MGGTWQQGCAAANPHSASPQTRDALYARPAPGPGFRHAARTLQRSIRLRDRAGVRDSTAQCDGRRLQWQLVGRGLDSERGMEQMLKRYHVSSPQTGRVPE